MFQSESDLISDDFPLLDLRSPVLGDSWLSAVEEGKWRTAFEVGRQLRERLQLKPGDDRWALTLRTQRQHPRCAFLVGGQMLFSLEFLPTSQSTRFRFQVPGTSAMLDGWSEDAQFQPARYEGKMVLAADLPAEQLGRVIEGVVEVAAQVLDNTQRSQYRKVHVPMLDDVLADPAVEEAFLAFLGAPWGRKMTQVYRRLLADGVDEGERKLWGEMERFRAAWPGWEGDLTVLEPVLFFPSAMHATAGTFWRALFQDRENAQRYLRAIFDPARGVEERLEFAARESKRILRAHRLDWHSTSQDERTLSMLWAALDPEHHAPFRAAHYKDHCRRVGLEPAPPRKRYGHFLQLLEAFAAEWVVPDATLNAAHQAAWAGQGAAGESGLPVAARIWRGVWGRVWSSEKDDMKHNPNDEPEVIMSRGAPFDPEAIQGTYWI
jgi:hypothetical protein